MPSDFKKAGSQQSHTAEALKSHSIDTNISLPGSEFSLLCEKQTQEQLYK